MSGIYIPGMEMPTNCMDCPFKGFDRAIGRGNICTINETITFHAVLDGLDVKFVRMGDCPLIPVPEHGRLIDADALLDDLLFPSKQFEQGMRELVGDAHTIIPSSKEGEG